MYGYETLRLKTDDDRKGEGKIFRKIYDAIL